MTVPCDRVSEFADGELSAAETEAFQEHLVSCPRCAKELEAIFALRGLAETALPPPGPGGLPGRPRGRWQALLWAGAGLAACGAMVGLLLRPLPRGGSRRPDPGPLAAARPEVRWLEPRLDDSRADGYHHYDPMRGGGEVRPPLDFAEMAALQKAGDVRGLVSRWIVARDLGQARSLLALAEGDRGLDNERAAVALLAFAPADALRFADSVLAREPRAPQALWNRALALRDLRFDYGSAAAFEAVAALGEPGWSEEAGLRAARLRAGADERRQRWEAAARTVARLAQDGPLPPYDLVVQYPDLVRGQFYEATRSATTRAGLDRLRPLARQLDLAYESPGVLVHALDRLRRLDPRVRAPLVAACAELRARGAQDPALLAATVARLRRAGPAGADLLLAVLLDGAAQAALPGEITRLARASADPWFDAAVAEVIYGQGIGADGDEVRQAALVEAAEAAGRSRLESPRLRLTLYRAYLLIDGHHAAEGVSLLQQVRLTAQNRGLWIFESPALVKRVVGYHGDSDLLAAYRDELVRATDSTPAEPVRR